MLLTVEHVVTCQGVWIMPASLRLGGVRSVAHQPAGRTRCCRALLQSSAAEEVCKAAELCMQSFACTEQSSMLCSMLCTWLCRPFELQSTAPLHHFNPAKLPRPVGVSRPVGEATLPTKPPCRFSRYDPHHSSGVRSGGLARCLRPRAMSARQPTVDDVTTTNTLEVWRDKLHRESR